MFKTISLILFFCFFSLIFTSIVNADTMSSGSWGIKLTVLQPNYCPIASNPNPANNSIEISMFIGVFSIYINDTNGDYTNGTIECSSGDSRGWNELGNGTKGINLSLLSFNTTYYVWVNFTDGTCIVKNWYTFNTTSKPPNPVGSTPGWKMVSIPKNDTVDKLEVYVRNETNNYTWADAVTNNIVLNFVYYWNVTRKNWAVTDVGPYQQDFDFSGWTGTFVYFYDTDYNIWINHSTGSGPGGNDYDIYLHQDLINVTGTHTYHINETGYVVWANYSGYGNLSINGSIGGGGNMIMLFAIGANLFMVSSIMLFRRKKKKDKEEFDRYV